MDRVREIKSDASFFWGFDPFLKESDFLVIFELNGIKLNEQLN